MTRFLSAACCALLPLAATAQRNPPGSCPARPAECQVSTPVYNFGRHELSVITAPIYGEGTVSITCTKAQGQGFTVDLSYDLMAIPGTPSRVMRDRELGYLRYDLFVDPGRRQYWGDGTAGSKTFSDKIELNDANRVLTVSYQVYGTVYDQQIARPGQWLGFVSARLEYTIKRCR
jgi:spore coat protein U-like protein